MAKSISDGGDLHESDSDPPSIATAVHPRENAAATNSDPGAPRGEILNAAPAKETSVDARWAQDQRAAGDDRRVAEEI